MKELRKKREIKMIVMTYGNKYGRRRFQGGEWKITRRIMDGCIEKECKYAWVRL